MAKFLFGNKITIITLLMIRNVLFKIFKRTNGKYGNSKY